MRQKQFLFYLILLLPALLLAVVLAVTAAELYAVRSIKPAEMLGRLREHLEQKSPSSFPMPDKLFIKDESKHTVFAFGSSDLLLSDGGVFPDYLEQHDRELNVINFGISGIDSFSVRQRIMEALALARPDLIILFFGHNDFNTAYHSVILPEYFEKFNALLRLPYLFHNKEKRTGVMLTDDFYWYSRLTRPKLYQAFQKLNVLALDHTAFEPIDALILEHFIRNYEAVLKVASTIDVPVLVLTPIGNLRAEPYGDLRTTTAWYRQGMTTRDYEQSLTLLKKARDSEIITYDLRAKSGMLNYLRSLRRPGVYVLDLENSLEKKQFGFGYSDFLDYVHLNDKTHRMLADMVYDYLVQNNLHRKFGGKKAQGNLCGERVAQGSSLPVSTGQP